MRSKRGGRLGRTETVLVILGGGIGGGGVGWSFLGRSIEIGRVTAR
jgi:hypothetical protein